MEITDYVMVNPGDNAEFACTVKANPINEDTIKWTREGFDMEARTVATKVDDVMFLTVKNVSSEDSGTFDCVANNGIGQELKNTTFLLVRGESDYFRICRAFHDIKEEEKRKFPNDFFLPKCTRCNLFLKFRRAVMQC